MQKRHLKSNTVSSQKTLRKLVKESNFLHMIKDICENPTANIVLNDERLNAFPLRSGIRQGCLFSPLQFKIVLDVQARSIRQEKETEGIQTGKEETLSLFTDDTILDMETILKNPKESY